MEQNTNKQSMWNGLTRRGLTSWVSAAVLGLACLSSPLTQARDRDGEYQQVNLVSDQPGVALLLDTNLVNAWGISFSTNSPFWVSANGSGRAVIYSVTNDSTGMPHVSKAGLEVTIPGAGNPSGQVFNDTGAFHGDPFIFASEDGTISGWRPALGTAAEVLTNRSTAVYKGITLATGASGPLLLAANFSEGTLDAYDTNLMLVGQFTDAHAPTNYSPFNVQTLEGIVFVTFAKPDAGRHDDVQGPGHGLIDIFNPKTGTFRRLATGSDAGGHLKAINSPWGLAISPRRGFGGHGDQLLVGNFGSGTIMAFSERGEFTGLLEGRHERPIVIDGLWGLAFGNGARAGVPGTLYFTAGPVGESHGLFGSLEAIREHHHEHDHDDD